MEVVEKGSPVGLHLFPSETTGSGSCIHPAGTAQPGLFPGTHSTLN
jgi:hypothetical protein